MRLYMAEFAFPEKAFVMMPLRIFELIEYACDDPPFTEVSRGVRRPGETACHQSGTRLACNYSPVTVALKSVTRLA